jgi:ketosteroid isomerase-like protein
MQTTNLAPGRTPDIQTLEELNRHFIRSAEQSDAAWYREHLAEDFRSSQRDGSIVDRAAFLQRISGPYPGTELRAVDVQIRFVGELALIHAGFRYKALNGQMGTGRYTDIYTRRQQRWLCVSAHFNRF